MKKKVVSLMLVLFHMVAMFAGWEVLQGFIER